MLLKFLNRFNDFDRVKIYVLVLFILTISLSLMLFFEHQHLLEMQKINNALMNDLLKKLTIAEPNHAGEFLKYQDIPSN